MLIAGVSVANAQPGSEPPPMEPPAMEPPAVEPMPDEPPPPPGPAAAPPPAAEPPPSTVDAGVIADANSGRGWLLPTALTPPAGTWSFSSFELFVIGGGYAITDQLQVSLTTLIPLTSDFPILGLLSGKYQVIKAGRVRGAVQAAVFYADTKDEGDSSVTVFNAGGALTYCIDAGCHSHATGYLGTGFASADQSAFPLMFGASLALKVGRHVKFVLEADSAAIVGEIDAVADGFLLWYGARFTSKFIGVDLGFAKPIYEGSGEDDFLPLGFPFVAFTYRSLN